MVLIPVFAKTREIIRAVFDDVPTPVKNHPIKRILRIGVADGEDVDDAALKILEVFVLDPLAEKC